MIKQLAVWKLLVKSLRQEIPAMLLYVLESKGSSPGRQGFAMAVNGLGEMEGSIGGGIMEHKFVEMAKEKFKEASSEISVRKQIHDKSAAKNQSGMICSGEQVILLYRVSEIDFKHIDSIINALENDGKCTIQLSPMGLSADKSDLESDCHFAFKSDADWLYREKSGYKNFVHIVGAGHCSLPLSRIMSMLDFHVHLYDDRPELNTFHQNAFANRKTTVKSYSDLKDLIPAGNNQYVVIMTVGYRTDDEALKTLMGKNFKYLGMLGSKTKADKLLGQYKEGGNDYLINSIHSPVGIQIHSQTPEEIAVSIAAEIIGIKNAGN